MPDDSYASSLVTDLNARLTDLRARRDARPADEAPAPLERPSRINQIARDPFGGGGIMATPDVLLTIAAQLRQSASLLSATGMRDDGDDVMETADHLEHLHDMYAEADAAITAGPEAMPRPATLARSARSDDPDADLGRRVRRLSHLRDWLRDDPELRALVDTSISGHVHAAEERIDAKARARDRQQVVFSVALTLASLLAGWLLSLASSPAALAGLLSHH